MRIAHVSDTHLGRRISSSRRGIINNETRVIESDFYDSWEQFIDLVIEESPDIILHSGDFFDTPDGHDRNPPPEHARRIAAKSFKRLERSGIPFVVIDGNHGRYTEYRSSTLSSFDDIFSNFFLFSHYDLRDAIREQRPLYHDFQDLNLRVIAHPALDLRTIHSLGIEKFYHDWIKIQTSSVSSDMINVGIAHGAESFGTLSPEFLKGNFHYIALGDIHKMEQVSKHAWYSGSTERWNLDEYDREHGYLLVNVEKEKAYPSVNKRLLKLDRKIISEHIKLEQNYTDTVIQSRVDDIYRRHGLNEQYDPKTAARVRIILDGEFKFGSNFELGRVESYLRSKSLDSHSVNVAEFILKKPKSTNEPIDSLNDPIGNVEYLIADPEKEFHEYITTRRQDALNDENLDPKLLSTIFAETLVDNFEDT